MTNDVNTREGFRFCSSCEFSVFDVLWGEWKCKKFQHVITDICNKNDCSEWKKSTFLEFGKDDD